MTEAQCNEISVLVSSSDTTYCQLYQPGYFLIDSGYANVCFWEIITLDGEPVYSDTTSGEFQEQSSILFDHTVPLTDSMHVTLEIINEIAGISCLISDTLAWETEEILPGSFIGNWVIVGNNGGSQDSLILAADKIEEVGELIIFPNPASESVNLISAEEINSIKLFDISGKCILHLSNIHSKNYLVQVSELNSGIYFIEIINSKNQMIRNKLIKS
ncbi:MAG: T9SS type A sorting domain-containing protein [Bacteroidia bacterium]